jgi:hypothetical protein
MQSFNTQNSIIAGQKKKAKNKQDHMSYVHWRGHMLHRQPNHGCKQAADRIVFDAEK